MKRLLLALGMLLYWPTSASAGSVFLIDFANRDAAGKMLAAETQNRFNQIKIGDRKGFGDVALAPFGNDIEYKLNLYNFDVFLGDELAVPLQISWGDLESSSDPNATNEVKLLDPTQGLAFQFPFAWRYQPKSSRFCNFKVKEGQCIVGADATLRYMPLTETSESAGTDDQWIFGASAAVRASLLFPIFEQLRGADGQKGHLGLSFGFRYLYQDTDNQDLLFGPITDPDGNPIQFKKDLASFSAESEIEIYNRFRIRLEYFRPLNNKDVLDEVFKASLVFGAEN
ncbi:MAG: hypothetical protein QNJ00_10000 [Woeseiaceae bacterium]|nr:hypothetical protein [Woeseiaceae bacterium]